MDFDTDYLNGRYDSLHGDEDELEAELTEAEQWESFIELECDDMEIVEKEGITIYTFADNSTLKIKKGY